MKYIVVTGGVVSGLGKGVTISSMGRMLQGCGLRVTSIKIDPYLNVDAGTMSPFEHGEVSCVSCAADEVAFSLLHLKCCCWHMHQHLILCTSLHHLHL